LGYEIGNAIMSLHTANGIQFRMEAGVSHYEEGSTGCVGSVVLTSGEKLLADIVILGVGVRPQTDYLKGSEIKLEKDGSVLVNERLQYEKSNIYVAGDIATFKFHNINARIEHWNVAQQHGERNDKVYYCRTYYR
jgi:NADPH-dependent 2,4-dienoyl-CoA reductase/sulfur reductase-like enzyme